ncbi:MAG: 3D domain-containing protein [Phycisphaerales bacterium]|nr:3D domain-containing protein [Phycisphaerales bacterium]
MGLGTRLVGSFESVLSRRLCCRRVWEAIKVKNNWKQVICSWRARLTRRSTVELGVFAGLAVMAAVHAAMVKEATHMPALASVSLRGPDNTRPEVVPAVHREAPAPVVVEPTPAESKRAEKMIERVSAETRWFNGRPVRPARVLWMQVTAYSPDARSCGQYADGKTATLHSVETNGGNLVAADTRLLPFGSMLSIEGYDDGQIVPVLDRGGAIKGYHIDLLMPTHGQARQWGDKRMPVIVWEFADGKPAEDPRKFR